MNTRTLQSIQFETARAAAHAQALDLFGAFVARYAAYNAAVRAGDLATAARLLENERALRGERDLATLKAYAGAR